MTKSETRMTNKTEIRKQKTDDRRWKINQMADTGYLMPVEPESSIEDPGSLHINVTKDINENTIDQ